MKIDFNFSKTIKGFMDDIEAERLYATALKASKLGPCLEIGSYCGKSAYFIGMACQQENSILFSIDHHHGSEEHQKGEEYFDPETFDNKRNCIDTFKMFQDTIDRASLTDAIVPIVAESVTAEKMWSTPVAMLFIDGGHSFAAAETDYKIWSPHIMDNGFLVIHDIFMNDRDGGQAPRYIYEKALGSEMYEDMGITGTLGVLRKKRILK